MTDRDQEAFEVWFKTADTMALDRYWAEETWDAALTYDRAQACESMAWQDVIAERRRQITKEGWTPQHDNEHTDGSLAHAAACYAHGDLLPGRVTAPGVMVPWLWPKSWHPSWWKPSTRRRDLVKAGALILAEIERLDRIANICKED